jgi:hypothetical protein
VAFHLPWKIVLPRWSKNFLLLWNPKVHRRIHKSYPRDPIMSHLNTVHITFYFSSRYILIVTLRLRQGLKWSVEVFRSNFICISHFFHATCLVIN